MKSKPSYQELAKELEILKDRDPSKQLLDLADVVFIELDTDGIIRLVNKKACEIFGYDEKEIIGKKWLENFVPKLIDKLPVSQKMFSEEIELEEYFENSISTKNGEEKLIYWHTTPIEDTQGIITGYLCLGKDISEYKKEKQEFFIKERQSITPTSLRFGMLSGLLIYAIFGFLDVFMMPSNYMSAWTIRYIIMAPILLTFFALSYWKIIFAYQKIVLFLLLTSGQLGIIAMIWLSNPQDPAFHAYYAGLILVMLWGSFVFRLDFKTTVNVSISTIIFYNLTAIIQQKIAFSPADSAEFAWYLGNNFFLISSGMLAIIGAYKLDKREKELDKIYIKLTQDKKELIHAKKKAEERKLKLQDRIKELHGIYLLDLLTEKHESLDTIYSEFVNNIVPKSMQFPDKVFVSLEVDNRIYCNNESFNLPESKNSLCANINAFKKQVGRIVVAYTNDKPFIDIFEQKLIDTYAERISNITERIKAEQKLIIAKENAEESNRLKTEFLNNMSHEIRTPMNGILGFTDLLSRPNLSDEKKKQFINVVQNSGNQLLRIIDDILEISKLGTKQVKTAENKVCLNNLLFEMFLIQDIKAKENKTPLYLKNALSDQESTIFTDETKLHKIINNLLENALKFTNTGYIEFGYQLKADSDPLELELYVKDTGIGIKPEKQDIIFDRFSQEEKELTQNIGGLGLGLSIAKENAELLGGRISVESEKGKGATFFVTIPYKPAYSRTDISDQASKDDLKSPDERYTVLVVEDEEINYLYLEAVILNEIELECDILHAKNGQEAVDMCRSNSDIDIVLMDMKMPVMNGYEATKLIKEFRPDLAIVAQTAYSTTEDKNKAKLAGCDDFMSKPISTEMLSSMIVKYLGAAQI